MSRADQMMTELKEGAKADQYGAFSKHGICCHIERGTEDNYSFTNGKTHRAISEKTARKLLDSTH